MERAQIHEKVRFECSLFWYLDPYCTHPSTTALPKRNPVDDISCLHSRDQPAAYQATIWRHMQCYIPTQAVTYNPTGDSGCIQTPLEQLSRGSLCPGRSLFCQAVLCHLGSGGTGPSRSHPDTNSWTPYSQHPKHHPRGSKYPILKDSGPKSHSLNGIWDLESNMGSWTLWARN